MAIFDTQYYVAEFRAVAGLVTGLTIQTAICEDPNTTNTDAGKVVRLVNFKKAARVRIPTTTPRVQGPRLSSRSPAMRPRAKSCSRQPLAPTRTRWPLATVD